MISTIITLLLNLITPQTSIILVNKETKIKIVLRIQSYLTGQVTFQELQESNLKMIRSHCLLLMGWLMTLTKLSMN